MTFLQICLEIFGILKTSVYFCRKYVIFGILKANFKKGAV